MAVGGLYIAIQVPDVLLPGQAERQAGSQGGFSGSALPAGNGYSHGSILFLITLFKIGLFTLQETLGGLLNRGGFWGKKAHLDPSGLKYFGGIGAKISADDRIDLLLNDKLGGGNPGSAGLAGAWVG
jgi:hypothetical protein